jgi:predicted nuclease of restriction endonuclease-like (RecB) superfamily
MTENENTLDCIEAVKKIKAAILQSRYMAARLANAEQLKLYFGIGAYVSANSREHKWGTGAIEAISRRLQIELPGLRGFSARSIKYMRTFYEAWNAAGVIRQLPSAELEQGQILHLPIATIQDNTNRQSSIADLPSEDIAAFLQIGFTHHISLLERCKDMAERWYYIRRCAAEFWSVEALKAHIKADDFRKYGVLPNNFALTLPDARQAAMAVRAFRDEYLLDYINIDDADSEQDVDERELNKALVREVKKFIQSLGHDFCYIADGFRVIEEDEESFIDILFFHRGLKCLVAIELKRGRFKPIYLGQLNYYLSVLDDRERHPDENPSVGLILCREAKRRIVELAIRDFGKPMGVATYRLGSDIPKDYSTLEPLVSGVQQILDKADDTDVGVK